MDPKDAFLKPNNSTHKQYEALRAFFVEGRKVAEIAKTFGYQPGTFRVMCSLFRKHPERQFFCESRRGPKPKTQPQDDLRTKIVELRKQNLSVYDIEDRLQADGRSLTTPTIARILKEEGFARLPRRRDEERPAKDRPEIAAVADVKLLDLGERSFSTKFGGLFLLLPILAQIPFDRIIEQAGFPGSGMIPPPHAVRSILALKLFGNARHTHVMSDVFDPGLALFAGLNVIPKTSFLSQYSCRVEPDSHPQLLRLWFDGVHELGYRHGTSFDLDFHTIPSHGQDPLLQKHYTSRRSRRQKGILSFVANDTDNRAFCYVNADLRKETQNDEILRFIEFWKEKSGCLPRELVFDSTFTTNTNLSKINQLGIDFITLRRRSAKLLHAINATPDSLWRRIELENVTRQYRTPKILEEHIGLAGYDGPLRQFAIKDLGHEKPTLLITNQMKPQPAELIQRYARRMIIENNIADAVDFFHMDALSSTVPLKVDFDLAATVMASTIYRIFAARIANGYENAKFSRIFRDFIHANAYVSIDQRSVIVRFQKRAHNPLLMKTELLQKPTKIPWLGNKKLQVILG